jgi:hypothetical protein
MPNGPSQAARRNIDTIKPKNPEGMTFGADDALRWRTKGAREQPDDALFTAATWTLQLGDWTSFKARARELFAAIPPAVLAADPAESEMEAFRRALKISLAVVVFAADDRREPQHIILQHLIKSLHKGVLAIEERSRGVDEPLLRATRSSTSPRENQYTKCVKTWCAMAGHALVSMGISEKEAAGNVADIVNRHKFLPPKRSGISIGLRSVLNWMARWNDGDLKFPCYPEVEFGDAFHLLDQGNPNVARRKLLKILTDRLNERKNFQMYPLETSAVS